MGERKKYKLTFETVVEVETIDDDKPVKREAEKRFGNCIHDDERVWIEEAMRRR